MDLNDLIKQCFHAVTIEKKQLVQSLWSGYGEIARCYLVSSKHTASQQNIPNTIIAKSVTPPKISLDTPHPRGWSGPVSHARKLDSYQVETNWYQDWLPKLPPSLKVPRCYATFGFEVKTDIRACSEAPSQNWVIIMSDLDAEGFFVRRESLAPSETKSCLRWLAQLHGHFAIENAPPSWPEGLWETGTYWHLSTRQQEWENMTNSRVKEYATAIDDKLNQCRFKTILHGDAKVANFCFNSKLDKVAMVDFQYVGGGCGMKDVIYFLGSCLEDNDCEKHHQSLLDYYFSELEKALSKKNVDENSNIDIKALISEWRDLYCVAWADFNRFIIGWAPKHHKNNAFSAMMTNKAIVKLAEKSH